MNSFIKKIKSNDVMLNIGAAFLIKGLAMLISLFTLPAYIKYFNNETVLGLWFTILSIVNWILSFDLGIGNGLRNNLVRSLHEENKLETKELVSSAYIITTIISIVIFCIGTLFIQSTNWNRLLNISNSLVSERVLTFVVECAFIGVMLQFVLRLINSILYSLQKSSVNNFLALITSILQLVFIVLVPSVSVEINLVILSLFFIISVNMPLVIATISIFKRHPENLVPSLKYYKSDKAKLVMSVGGVFFWCQIMFMLITTTNEFFISRLISPGEVVTYQIYNKLFTIIGSLFMLALTPLWSAITKELVIGNLKWIKSVYKKLNYFVILGVAGQFLLIPFLQPLINLWLGNNKIIVNYNFAVVFAIYGSIFLYQSTLSTMVCGMNDMKIQSIFYTLAVILKFSVFLLFGKQISNWIYVVILNIIILTPYCVIQPYFIRKKLNKYLGDKNV